MARSHPLIFLYFLMASSDFSEANFRICAKNIFLTYPQCPVTPQVAHDALAAIVNNFHIMFLAVAQELHQDGSPHLHALIMLSRKMDSRNPRMFDLLQYHPNIQVARKPKDVWDYLQKDGPPITMGQPPDKTTPRKNRGFRAILRNAQTKEAMLEMIKEQYPYEWSTKLRFLEYAAQVAFPDPPPPPFQSPHTNFIVPDPLKQWADDNIFMVSKTSYS